MHFDLEKLHWREFEKLAGFYLKARVGEGVTIFSGSKDKGRDATFEGLANDYPSRSQPGEGKWIFQCKHRSTKNSTSNAVENELIKQLNRELNKVFVKQSFDCDNYVLITNVDLSNGFGERAKKVFDSFCTQNNIGASNLFIIDYKDLEIFLSSNPRVRFAFPALLQYVDLEKVFLGKEDVRNIGFLSSAYDRIGAFAAIGHYQEAINKIRELGFLMLVGNPKSGKTSIVEAIALSFMEEANYIPYFIRTADEFFTIAANLPEDQKALFICDDIFGRHDLDDNRRREWESYFQSVMGIIGSRFKFLVTTRLYIYRQFANRSGLHAFFPDEEDPSRYTIRLVELTTGDREQILEKHLAFSSLSDNAISRVIRMKPEILNCKDFSPEVIRSLVSILERSELEDYAVTIQAHLDHPNQYLFDFFDNIDTDKKLLLISLCVSLSPEDSQLERAYVSISDDFGHRSDIPFRGFLEELSGSIIKRRDYLSSIEFEYYHPSMYEVILSICKADLRYRSLILMNANLEILGLLTLLTVADDDSYQIQIGKEEVILLHDAMQRLISNSNSLSEVSSSMKWLRTIHNVEVPQVFQLSSSVKDLEKAVGELIRDKHFLDRYLEEPIERWITFLDISRLILRVREPPYLTTLEEHHRDYKKYDYWRLLFLIETVTPGFIEHVIPPEALDIFLQEFSSAISQLAAGLNIYRGRPKTHPRWVPLFTRVNELVSNMKASGRGRQLLETEQFRDWQVVNQNSDFAKNRHKGMVSKGYWSADINPHLISRLDEPLTKMIGGIPICPGCESIMALRTASFGDNAGSQFYGCSRYPFCEQTLPV